MPADKHYITTPKGRFLWAKLTKPDTRFNENGEYSCSIILEEDDAAPLIAEIEEAFAKNLVVQRALNGEKTKAYEGRPYESEMDEDGDPTGRIIFKTKLPALVQRKGKEDITFRPVLFNRRGQPFDAEEELGENGFIGNGTVGKLQVEVRGWYAPKYGAGVKLSLAAAQIIDLVKGGGMTAEDRGFTDEEAGDAEGFVNEEASGNSEEF